MIQLSFAVESARPMLNAAAPALAFRLRIREALGQAIHAILLRAQLQIEPRRRKHSREEQERLADVFGAPDRWSESLHPLVWAQSAINVPPFEREIDVDVPVACTYDFEVTAAKYLAALEGGDLPLRFLFSGTVFAKSPSGFLVQQVPWDREAVYRMPLAVWREVMDAYFPGAAWIRVRRETLAALQRFRAKNGSASWDEAIEMMLGEAVR